jgi:SAM-dependent methyltransferase
MLHEDRGRAESFGADAEAYDALRPGYPEALFDHVVDEGTARVLDVGTGTGIAARAFLRRGLSVLGVEPDPRMAAVARRRGVPTEVASFETWDRAGRTFDLVASAQAWHWVDPRAGAAAAAAALRPGGRIALFWNYGRPAAHLREAFARAYRDEPDLERHSVLLGHVDDRLATTADALTASGAFEDVALPTWRWTRPYAGDAWVAHLFTHSDHAALPAGRRAALEARVAEAVDGLGGDIAMDYDACLVTARRA